MYFPAFVLSYECSYNKRERNDDVDNQEIIQNSIDYIEQNIKAEISAQELADKAGFSLFHYYRLFQSAVGMPVMQYIVLRKLLYAIYEISGGEKMIDIALQFGFDTHAGFYKAFLREFGCTPSYFLKMNKVRKPYKIDLFKEEHIMMTHKKISEILRNWNIENEKITDIFYDNGNQNDAAYYVGNSYILKLSANYRKLKNHIDISKVLENIGLSAATPIKTNDGKEIVEYNDIYFILTNRLQGERINAGDIYADDYKAKARFIGEIIGQLSLALKNADMAVNDVNIFESVVSWAMPKAKETIYLPDDLCNDYINTFGKLYSKLPKQIIHRDPNPSNIILANDKWGFIDFELSEKNVRIFDPCYAATAILSESFAVSNNERLQTWIEVYKNIIYGYDNVIKLSDEELKAIPYVVLSNQLICVAWFSGQEKYKDVLEANKKMTKWIIDNFERLAIE